MQIEESFLVIAKSKPTISTAFDHVLSWSVPQPSITDMKKTLAKMVSEGKIIVTPDKRIKLMAKEGEQ